jgi:hypothetical protein
VKQISTVHKLVDLRGNEDLGCIWTVRDKNVMRMRAIGLSVATEHLRNERHIRSETEELQ